LKLGTPLMPWQQQVFDVALELHPVTGRLVYREVVLTVPRQSGKTTLLLVLILLRALGARAQNIRYTAQTGSDARKKWMDDWLPALKESPFSAFYRERLTNGHEALLFKNGSLQGLVATTKKSGHGGSLDLGILDEAFAHPDARLEQALKPAMITRPQPQLWIVSTAGTKKDSPYLWGKVETGRAMVERGLTDSTAYFEWSAAKGLDPADPATWWSCMPALGHTVTRGGGRGRLRVDGARRVRARVPEPVDGAAHEPVIPLAVWDGLADPANPDGSVSITFDVSPDGRSAAIAAGWTRSDGLQHVDLVDHRDGTDWLVGRMVEMDEKYEPASISCDAVGPAAAFVQKLKNRGITVETVTGQEHARACGSLMDAVNSRSFRHSGRAALDTALKGAARRPLGDSWAWTRKTSTSDICPLVALTLALRASSLNESIGEPMFSWG
jgi:phage terminase large subunit-like protein